ncbi:MAG: hypothetical protein JSV89_00340 [Spirochaetaceae bacterium]|nr:MAG: hypothetical protein JSV89_00340 [Spirochaetaceae bacterium]
MKHTCLVGAVLAMGLLYPQFGGAGNPTVQNIISELQRTDAAREASIHDMVYTAETTVVEWEDVSRTTVKSETLSMRTVYVREPDQMRNEYLSMSVDGRELGKKEIQRELARQRRGGRSEGEREYQSPFSPEATDLYKFTLKGEDVFAGQAVWLVDFRPKEPEENLFAGTAFVSQSAYQVVFVEMVPAVLPGVLKEFSMNVRFAPVGEYWLPSVFSMDMRVRISFLVTLAERIFSIEDRYSDYRLNVGLDERIFTGE